MNIRRLPTTLPLLVALLSLIGRPAAAQIPGGAQFDSLTSRPKPEPDRVEFQQIFLPFEKSLPTRTSKRSRAAADSLSRALLSLARDGASFDSLIVVHASERPPARYKVVNSGQRPGAGERPRKSIEDAVADMAFGLAPGETGLVIPNNTTCRYGYYVIRRVH